jgi:acyl-ACP thioesterase
MYQYKNRVSYSQLDIRGTLGISHVVDVMQDACMFHCEEVGRSCMDLKKEDRAWLVSSWYLELNRLPKLGETYLVSTWPHQIKGVFNCQNVVLQSLEGEVYACGDSKWFFYDHKENKPVIIPAEEKEYYQIEPPYEMGRSKRKLSCPDNLELAQKVTVCANYLDTNNHMNNGQYVRLAMNMLPGEFEVEKLHAEFRNAARMGDVLYIKTVQKEDVFYVVFMNEEDVPYFLSEFHGRSKNVCS